MGAMIPSIKTENSHFILFESLLPITTAAGADTRRTRDVESTVRNRLLKKERRMGLLVITVR
jgi:hypothetical protein